MRTPGHGGRCFPGIITPEPEVYLPTTPGTLMEFIGAWDGKRFSWRRFFWRMLRNRETIRIALFAMMIVCQLWIDGFLIVLWAK